MSQKRKKFDQIKIPLLALLYRVVEIKQKSQRSESFQRNQSACL